MYIGLYVGAYFQGERKEVQVLGLHINDGN